MSELWIQIFVEKSCSKQRTARKVLGLETISFVVFTFCSHIVHSVGTIFMLTQWHASVMQWFWESNHVHMLLIKDVEKIAGGRGCAWKVKWRWALLITCYMVEIIVVYFTYFITEPYKISIIITIASGTNNLLLLFSCSVVSDSLQPHGLQQARLPVLHDLPVLAQTHVTESVRPSNHPILCHPVFLLPSVFLSIRVFSNDSALRIR